MTQSYRKICRQLMLTDSPRDTHHIIMKVLEKYGEYKNNNKKEKTSYGR